MNVKGDVPPAKRLRQDSSAASGLNADALSSNQVSVEQQVVNLFKLVLSHLDNYKYIIYRWRSLSHNLIKK